MKGENDFFLTSVVNPEHTFQKTLKTGSEYPELLNRALVRYCILRRRAEFQQRPCLCNDLEKHV
jgi:hypothetical protein